MSNKILIDIMNENNFDAGTKARNDVASILRGLNFESSVIFNRTHNNLSRTIEMLKAVKNIGQECNDNDMIVLQYPYNDKVMSLLLNRVDKLRKKKRIKLVILIHDILYLRNEKSIGDDVSAVKQTEIGFFNRADAVIVHNSSMLNTLKNDGVTSKMYELGIFDYIYDGPKATITDDKKTLVFAGNLSPEKSGFIYNYSPEENIRINLYGTQPQKLSSSFDYKGSFPPDDLISHMSGNYGLVWDGPSADSCDGNFGNYLRYNNPHKLSLYLASGLPVVVWSQSALAQFVKENGIGMAVDSLKELDSMPNPDDEKYREMLKNVCDISEKALKGGYLTEAIHKIKEDF